MPCRGFLKRGHWELERREQEEGRWGVVVPGRRCRWNLILDPRRVVELLPTHLSRRVVPVPPVWERGEGKLDDAETFDQGVLPVLVLGILGVSCSCTSVLAKVQPRWSEWKRPKKVASSPNSPSPPSIHSLYLAQHVDSKETNKEDYDTTKRINNERQLEISKFGYQCQKYPSTPTKNECRCWHANRSTVSRSPPFKVRASWSFELFRVKLDETTGRLSLDAPSTPYHELDLSDSFLAALHSAPWEPKKKTFSLQKRRLWFLVGGLLGILGG